MSAVLVTGGAGFIGSHIAEELVKEGYTVRVLDNLSTGKKDKLYRIKADFVKGDIRDTKTVKKCMKDIECVFHEAAIASIPKSIEDPILVNDVNVNGTLNVLVAAKDSGCRKLVFASSSSVYGNTTKLPIKEDNPLNPASPYAVTKLVGEQYCRTFYENYGLRTVCLRYFNVYGPRQDPNSEYSAVIPKFIARIKNNQPPIIFGDGKQTRDFIFVKDVVQANMLAMKTKMQHGIFNVGVGKGINLLELTEKINKSEKSSLKPIFSDSKTGDIKDSVSDISKIMQAVGFKPKYSLEQGLVETVEWFTSYSQTLSSSSRPSG